MMSDKPPVVTQLGWGPLNHAEFIHNEARGGRVIISSRDRRGSWHEYSVDIGTMPSAVCELRGQSDTYLTFNRFNGPRRLITRLRALDALYVDLDTYRLPPRNGIASMLPEAAAGAVLRGLEDRGIPSPSLIVFTGRGLSVCWVIDPVPAQALPRWRACQRHLLSILQPFGADPQALDAARSTRLQGTINTKSGLHVRVLEDHSSFEIADFERIADAVLPLSREDVEAQRKTRDARRDGATRPRPLNAYNVETLHRARVTDLMALMEGRWFGALPEGQRNAWMFHMACSLAWLTTPAGLTREMIHLGTDVAGWSTGEVKACIASVLHRAEHAAVGEEARYRVRTDTVIRDLGITEEEMRAFDLRCLVNAEISRERDATRKREQRREAGMVPRETYLAESRRRRQEAIDLNARGLDNKQVGVVMGRSSDAVRQILREARRTGMKPSPVLVPVTVVNNEGTRAVEEAVKSVQVYDGEPPDLVGRTKKGREQVIHPVQSSAVKCVRVPSETNRQNVTRRLVQLDLFDKLDHLPAMTDWTGGVMPDELRQGMRAVVRASGLRHDEVATEIGISRPQFGNILTGRFGTCQKVARRLEAWVREVAAA